MKLVDADGTVVEVGDPQAAAEMLSRGYGVVRGEAVNVVGEDGSVGNVNAEDLGSALQQGYRLASFDEIDTARRLEDAGERDVAAFGAAAARGATFGASDYLLEASGITDKRTLRELSEANPIASGIGEATGIIGSAVLTGGSGLLAKGGLATAAGATARLGQMAETAVAGTRLVQGLEAGTALGRAGAAALRMGAQGAVEGALYGAAKQVDDDWLNDREITTERIAMGAGLGALTGGAFGAGAGVLGSLGQDTVKGIAQHVDLDKLMRQRAVKAVVGQTKQKHVKLAGRFGETSEEGIEKVGQIFLDDAAESGFSITTASQEQIAAHARRRREFWGSRFDEIEQQADNALVSTGQRAVDGRAIANRIESEIIAPLEASGASRSVGRQLRRRFKDTLSDLRSQEEMSVTGARALRKQVDEFLVNHNKLSKTVADEYAEKARAFFERDIEEAIGRSGMSDAYAMAKQRYAVAKWADTATQDLAEGNLARRFVSPSDHALGTVAAIGQVLSSGGVGAGTLLVGALGSQANRIMRERGSQFVAGSIHEIKRMSLFKQAVKAENGIADAAEGFLSRAVRGATSLSRGVRSSEPMLGSMLVSNASSHDEMLDRISDLQRPDSSARTAMRMNWAPLADVDPDAASAIDAKVQTIADFLANKAGASQPQLGAPVFQRFAPPNHPSGDTERLKRYARAAEDPMSALGRIKAGEVVKEDVETLRELYPRLFARLQSRLMASVAEMSKRPDYQTRRAMEVLLGAPVESASTPEAIKAMQQQIANRVVPNVSAAEMGAPSQGGSVTPGNARPPQVAGAYVTRNQQILGGGQ